MPTKKGTSLNYYQPSKEYRVLLIEEKGLEISRDVKLLEEYRKGKIRIIA